MTRWRLVRGLGMLLLLGIGVVVLLERSETTSSVLAARCLEASLRMQSMTAVIAEHRRVLGPPIDVATDINQTGMIGDFYSPMTTTIGNLEAKRTSTDPNMAGLLVVLLERAGVRSGDFIAVGASGSFPALILATLSAAETLDVDVGLIVSLGASQWGANRLDFTWIEMERTLAKAGMLDDRAAALSVGGDLDIGRDLDTGVRAALRERIETAGVLLISEPNLQANVEDRMAVYRTEARGRPIRAFVNVGGSWANLGTDASVLNASPGLVEALAQPPVERKGVIHAMAEDGAAIIHLLNLKELVQRYGLSWDPSPVPAPGSLEIRQEEHLSPLAIGLGVGYLLVFMAWSFPSRNRRT
jgi:poly-gamma-glutamate system protein